VALEVNLTDGGGERDMVTVDRHWYLTEDGSRVVEENDPACRWLWASPGTEVPRADAVRLGAAKTDPPAAPEPAPEVVADTKARSAPPNKQLAKPGDKAPATVAELRAQAAELGVQVDNRWGAERLQQEIANAGSDD
jgi:hypothetical protein